MEESININELARYVPMTVSRYIDIINSEYGYLNDGKEIKLEQTGFGKGKTAYRITDGDGKKITPEMPLRNIMTTLFYMIKAAEKTKEMMRERQRELSQFQEKKKLDTKEYLHMKTFPHPRRQKERTLERGI